MKTLGYIVIIIGLSLTIFTTASIFSRKKVVEIERIEITREAPNRFKILPLVGIALLSIGGIVVWQLSKKVDMP